MAEFVEVGRRASLRAKLPGLTDTAIAEMALALREATYVESVAHVSVCRDPNDDKFIACAVATGAGYLVTEDKDLLALDGYCGLKVLSPAEFTQVLDADEEHAHEES